MLYYFHYMMHVLSTEVIQKQTIHKEFVPDSKFVLALLSLLVFAATDMEFV